MVPFCMFTLCDLMLYVPSALISRAMGGKKRGPHETCRFVRFEKIRWCPSNSKLKTNPWRNGTCEGELNQLRLRNSAAHYGFLVYFFTFVFKINQLMETE